MEGMLLKHIGGKWKRRHFTLVRLPVGGAALQQRDGPSGSMAQQLALPAGAAQVAQGAAGAGGKALAPVVGGCPSPHVFTLAVEGGGAAAPWLLAAPDEKPQ